MTETVIGFFRHGQTDWNVNMLLQGVTDVPMNEFGIAQVRTASSVLKPSDWDVLVTSPLGRAKHSADLLNSVLRLSAVHEEKLLLERSFGEAEGLSYEQWKSKFSTLDVIPGGESKSDLHSRSELLLETLKKLHPGKRILAVSHGALIRNVLAIVSNGELPRDGERLANASLNTIKYSDASWEMVDYQLEPLAP